MEQNQPQQFSFTKILNDIYDTEAEGTAHQSDWWRSSSLGSCRRGVFLTRLFSGEMQVQHDYRTKRVFELGNIIEDWIIANFEKLDKNEWLLIQQGEIYNPDYNLKGHFDLLLVHKPSKKGYLMECKSKNSRAFTYMDKKGEGAQHTHQFQLKSYLDTIKDFGFKLRSDDVFNYPNKDGSQTVYNWCMSNLALMPYGSLPLKNEELTHSNGTKNSFVESYFRVDIVYASILYVSKDDQRFLEYPISSTDTQLEKDWKEEVSILQDSWHRQVAPPLNDPTTWAGNGKYCMYCKAGFCGTLTDQQVKELFVLLKK